VPEAPAPHSAAAPAARRQRLARAGGVVVALLLAVVTVHAFGESLLATYRLKRQARALERQVAALRRANADLREEIRRLHSPAYIERLAREQLGLLRPGEITLILVRPTPTPPAAP